MLAGLIRSWGHEATYEERPRRVRPGRVRDRSTRQRVRRRGDDRRDERRSQRPRRPRARLPRRGLVSPGSRSARKTDSDGDPAGTRRRRVRDSRKPIGAHTISAFVMGPFFTGETTHATIDATMTHDVELGPDGFEYVIPVLLERPTTATRPPASDTSTLRYPSTTGSSIRAFSPRVPVRAAPTASSSHSHRSRQGRRFRSSPTPFSSDDRGR